MPVVTAGQFRATITGANGLIVTIESCNDLANPVWFPATTITLVNGSAYIGDPNWAGSPQRFYRLRMP